MSVVPLIAAASWSLKPEMVVGVVIVIEERPFALSDGRAMFQSCSDISDSVNRIVFEVVSVVEVGTVAVAVLMIEIGISEPIVVVPSSLSWT